VKTKAQISVVAVVGKKEKHVIVGDIALTQSRSKITLHRAHRISSIKRHHLKDPNAVSCESVNKNAKSGRKGTDVSLSSPKWLQAVLKSEANVFCGRTLIITLWASYRTSRYILASVVTSASWDEDGMISSFVGSVLIALIGRGLSGKAVRHGWITGGPS